MTTETMSEYRIYVASLADYNAGRLHGRWIDAAQDADEIEAEVKEMLAESREPFAEEWAIHDYELGGIQVGEWESFEKVAELAATLEEHGEAFAVWHNNDPDYNTDPERFTDEYMGEYDTEVDYAYEYVESTGMLDGMNESAAHYFDYHAFARDLFIESYWFDSGYVFTRS